MDVNEQFEQLIDDATMDDVKVLLERHMAQLLRWRATQIAHGVKPTLRLYTQQMIAAANTDVNPRVAWTSIVCGFTGLMWQKMEEDERGPGQAQ